MIDKTEAERIAEAVHCLRPDWVASSIVRLIGESQDLRTRAYRDLAVAFTYVACDSASLTPGRVRESGPWWANTGAQKATVSAVAMHCPSHPTERAWDCKPCADDVADIDTGLALVRAALKDAPPPPRPAHPTPPATDLRDTRTRIDTAEEA